MTRLSIATLALAACMLWVVAPAVLADMFEPYPMCSKPYKPYQFTSQWELESFREDVRRYKQCIMDFVEEQERAIETHRRAAEQAIDEWNSFVSLELN